MKILYGVFGIGNGHLSRARVLVPALEAAGAHVTCLFSGREPHKYFDMDAFQSPLFRRGGHVNTTAGKINKFRTAMDAITTSIPLIMREAKALDVSGYDLVIHDMEPITARAARRQNIPCLEISNFAFPRRKLPLKHHSWLERLMMHALLPSDYKICVHWQNHGYDHVIPPFLKTPPPDNAAVNARKIMVYMQFEDLTRISDFLAPHAADYDFVIYSADPRPRTAHPNLTFKPLSRQTFLDDLQTSHGLIANAGFVATSEALQMRKKILLKPQNGQAEQRSNAAVIQDMGLGTAMNSLDANILKTWLTQKHPAAKIHFPEDVANDLAAWIMAGDWNHPAALSQKLWTHTKFETQN